MKYLVLLSTLALPFFVFAQSDAALKGFSSIAAGIGNIVAILVPVVVSLAFVVFVWGVISYVLSKDPESQKKAKGTMIYGIIGITVIVGVWAIANFLLSQIGVNEEIRDVKLPGVEINQ